MRIFKTVLGSISLVVVISIQAQEDLTRLLRYPDIHGDLITFVCFERP